MRPVSETWKNSIYEKRKSLLLRAEMLLLTGTTLYLDYEDGDDDFMSDGLTFEDATSNESSFDVGNAVMNTFSFRLNNFNDKYSNTIFTDAVIIPYVGMELPDGTTEWVKKGKFIVSDPGNRGNVLSFTAYDFMQKLETAFSAVPITYPTTIGAMAQAICTFCGVTLATMVFPNSTYVISEAPAGSNYSCRQMISYIAQIAGCFARFNGDGELEIKWYEAVDTENQNYHEIAEYKTLETELKDITITGVKVSSYYNESSLEVDEDGNPVVENATSGSEGYMVSISNNPLIPYGKASEVANLLENQLVGTTFRPLNLATFYDPSMEAGDTAIITDIKGNTYSFFVTNMTAKLGADVKIICSAQTESDNLAEQYTGAAQVVLSMLEVTNAKFKDLAANHLKALVGEFGYLKADFSNLKEAEIDNAKINELFLASGYFQKTVTETGTVFNLTGVHIDAEDITSGSLSADRLNLKGEDGLYYQLNVTSLGETYISQLTEEEQLELQDHIHAKTIVAHSITTDELAVQLAIGANAYINFNEGTMNLGGSLTWDGENLEIDGGVIIDGSITSKQIDVADLFAQNITATGTIEGATLRAVSILNEGDGAFEFLNGTGKIGVTITSDEIRVFNINLGTNACITNDGSVTANSVTADAITSTGIIKSTYSNQNAFTHIHPTSGVSVKFGVGSGGYNRGILDGVEGGWIIYKDQSNNTYINDAVTTSGVYTRFAGHVVVMQMYGTRPGTVPAGYRPSSTVSVPVWWSDGTNFVHGFYTVSSAGVVTPKYVNSSNASGAPSSSYVPYGTGVWIVA